MDAHRRQHMRWADRPARFTVSEGSVSTVKSKATGQQQLFPRDPTSPDPRSAALCVRGDRRAQAASAPDGEDVIDLGFGNPDIPSPQVAVDKLTEAVRKPRNHRYSTSRGHPEAARGDCRAVRARFGVDARLRDRGRCSTIGAKEGFSHLMLVLVGPGDTALVPAPATRSTSWARLRRRGGRTGAMGPEQDFSRTCDAAYERRGRVRA